MCKKILSVVLCAIMVTALFCSCDDSGKNSSDADSSENSVIISSDTSEATSVSDDESKTSDESFEITVPHVTGSFIQP